MADVREGKVNKRRKKLKEVMATKKINKKFSDLTAAQRWKLVYLLLQEAGYDIDL